MKDWITSHATGLVLPVVLGWAPECLAICRVNLRVLLALTQKLKPASGSFPK